jgi:FtsP/CotA-like multicopper oxidase with cupredoxin domain
MDALPGLTAATPDTTTYPGSDYYEIALVEYKQRMHTDLPGLTTLRGYVQLKTAVISGTIPLFYTNGNPINDANNNQFYAAANPSYLGPLIIANKGVPTRIKFYNLLPSTTDGGNLFIPVDTTVMGAGIGPDGVNSYTQNRGTIHLHGGFTPWVSDGTPHQWVAPAIDTTALKAGVSTQHVPDMPVPSSGSMTFYFPNQQSSRLMWYHDHAYGLTRLNVYTGEVAGYLLQDKVEQGLVYDPTNNPTGVIPPNQIPLVIQDKTFVWGAHNTTATATVGLAGGAISSFLLSSGGSGYTSPIVTVTDITGTGAVITATAAGGVVNGLTIVTGGSNYTAPTVTISENTGTWATDPTWDPKWSTAGGSLWFPHVYMPNQNPYDMTGANAMGRWDYGPWFWPPFTGLMNGPIANPYYDPINAPWEPPQIPGTPNPSIVPEAFMDTPLVNGKVYPYLEVEPKAYRFRILNGCNDRFLNLQLYKADPLVTTPDLRTNTEVKMIPAVAGPTIPTYWGFMDGRAGGIPDPTTVGPNMIQIGTEGGFLPAPVELLNTPVGYNYNRRDITVLNVKEKTLFLGPAERADVIIDFSAYAGQTLILYNDAPGPVPAFDPRIDYYTGDPDQTDTGGAPTTLPGYGPNTRTIMQIRVANSTPATTYNLLALQQAFESNSLKMGAFAKSQDPILVPVAPYNSAYNATYPADAYARIQNTSLTFTPYASGVASITVTNGGTGYSATPTVTITGGGGSGATATATVVSGVIDAITVPVGGRGSGYTFPPTVTITDTTGIGATAEAVLTPPTALPNMTIGLAPKAIQELFETEYGRMNAILGVEIPNTTGLNQTTIPYNYIDPITETINASTSIDTPTTGDGTQLWKITHNGVDSHAIHVHLFNAQLINRVGWDGAVKPPDPNELGWKETIRMNPLEDCIIALRPTVPQLPFGLPDSIRLMDVTAPLGSTGQFTGIDPNGNPIRVTNQLINLGWEYVWHCHILGHEENDMMRPIAFNVPRLLPTAPVVSYSRVTNPVSPVILTWTDATPFNYITGIPISTLGNSANEIGFLIQRANVDVNGNPGTYTQIGSALANQTTYTDSTANIVSTYSYKVIAYNVAGNSPSNAITVVPPILPPAAPTNLTATLQAGPMIRLTWTDNDTNETGFVVERAVNGGAFSTLATVAPKNNTGSVSYTDTAVIAGNTYDYRVKAVNGGGSSAYSNTATVIISLPTPPAAPSGVTASAVRASGNNDNVTLTWTDNSSNETGFRIQRATNITFTAGLTTNTVGVNITTFQTGNVPRNTNYYFRVQAYNAVGTSAWVNATQFPIKTP